METDGGAWQEDGVRKRKRREERKAGARAAAVPTAGSVWPFLVDLT